MRKYANRGRGCHINANVRIEICLIQHLAHKLLTIVTNSFVLLKISVLIKLCLVGA